MDLIDSSGVSRLWIDRPRGKKYITRRRPRQGAHKHGSRDVRELMMGCVVFFHSLGPTGAILFVFGTTRHPSRWCGGRYNGGVGRHRTVGMGRRTHACASLATDQRQLARSSVRVRPSPPCPPAGPPARLPIRPLARPSVARGGKGTTTTASERGHTIPSYTPHAGGYFGGPTVSRG